MMYRSHWCVTNVVSLGSSNSYNKNVVQNIFENIVSTIDLSLVKLFNFFQSKWVKDKCLQVNPQRRF